MSGGLDVFMLLACRSVLVLEEPFVQEPGRKGTDLGLTQRIAQSSHCSGVSKI